MSVMPVLIDGQWRQAAEPAGTFTAVQSGDDEAAA